LNETEAPNPWVMLATPTELISTRTPAVVVEDGMVVTCLIQIPQLAIFKEWNKQLKLTSEPPKLLNNQKFLFSLCRYLDGSSISCSPRSSSSRVPFRFVGKCRITDIQGLEVSPRIQRNVFEEDSITHINAMIPALVPEDGTTIKSND
jgi:hypothetical protein